MVSGRPASTVYSRRAERSKLSSTAAQSRSSCGAESVVGVPPPKYSATGLCPSFFARAPVCPISVIRASRYGPTSFSFLPTAFETNEQ